MSDADRWLLAFAVAQAVGLLVTVVAVCLLLRRARQVAALAAAPGREASRVARAVQQLGGSAAATGRHLVFRVQRLRQVLRRRWETVRHMVEEIRRPAREEIPAAARTLRESAQQARAWTDRLGRLRRAATAASTPSGPGRD